MKVLYLVLLSLSAYAQPLKFTGEVKAGEAFHKPIGRGLVFVLHPQDNGWKIDVDASPRTKCEGYASVVAIPLRGRTALDLNTDYGISSRQVAAQGSFEFPFVLNEADCVRENEWGTRLRWPYTYSEKEQQEARDNFGSTASGRAVFTIRESRVNDTIEWVKFEVTITLPKKP